VDGVSRFACVRVEHFAAAALMRCEPALREQPLAAVAGAAPVTRIVEANARAREEGVRPGLVEAEALVRCPSLVRRPASVNAEAAARHALLEACLTVSPRLEDVAPGVAHVDLDGLRRLFGDEVDIGRRLVRHAHAVGLPARVGIATTRAAAGLAARVGPVVHVLPPGGERAALATMPLAALEWPPELAAAFSRWGLRMLGDLARLPRHGVGVRLGRAGLAAHDLATGVDGAPFRVWTPPPFWEEAQGLDWDIVALPALVPVLTRVLERLCARLVVAHLLIDVIEVRLALTTGGHHTRSMALAAPLAEPASIVALLALEIEAHPPPAPVNAVALSARAVPRRVAPGGLWHPPPPAPRDLATVLTRLTLLVGGANVGTPIVTDSHRPDAYVLAPFDGDAGDGEDARGAEVTSGADIAPAAASPAPASLGGGEPDPAPIVGPLGVRRLRPPRRVDVDTADGRPTRVRDAAGLDAAVLTSAGPWRLSGQWWDTETWARDEWDVALADHTLWRLCHDRLTDTWHLDALYD
jgi:protein ImuB